MEYQVFSKGSLVSFNSNLSNNEAIQIISSLNSNFAQDLTAKSKTDKGLSEKQWTWVHKLAVDSLQPAPEQLAIETSGLFSLFQNFKGNNPRIDINVNGVQLHITKAGPKSKYNGSIMVSHSGFGSPFYGVISLDGVFTPRNEASQPVIEAIKAFSSNPATLAAEHGHLTGNCCFCRRKLTDERSTNVGYGKDCASNYNLPWG